MARFVHAPDAFHYRQQLIHRIREEAPDLDPVLVAAGVTVEESPHESLRRQADGLPVQVWLVWEGQQLLGVHSTREGAEAALKMQRKARQGDLGERTASSPSPRCGSGTKLSKVIPPESPYGRVVRPRARICDDRPR